MKGSKLEKMGNSSPASREESSCLWAPCVHKHRPETERHRVPPSFTYVHLLPQLLFNFAHFNFLP